MPDFPTAEKTCRQDTFERLNKWVDVLEERALALLEGTKPEELKPSQREQAALRYLTLMVSLMQLRQAYEQTESSRVGQEILEELRRARGNVYEAGSDVLS